MVPETFAVSCSRAVRAAGTGRLSANRLEAGIARVRSTEMTVLTPRSAGRSWTVAATLSQTIATAAP